MQSSDQIGLTEQSLRQALGTFAPTLALHVHASIDSTNSEAKRLALSSAARPALIVADEQSAGRGRMGRSFYSPADTGIYCSFLIELQAPIADSLSLTSAAAVAVMRAIRSACGLQTSIKWVNDLYLAEKKVCGILAELLSFPDRPPCLILGIGINLSTTAFPAELSEIAGSLGCPALSRAALIAAICRELLPYLQHPEARDWLDDYRTHSMVLGKTISWTREGGTFFGTALEIDASGGLWVETESGHREKLQSGEISLRLR